MRGRRPPATNTPARPGGVPSTPLLEEEFIAPEGAGRTAVPRHSRDDAERRMKELLDRGWRPQPQVADQAQLSRTLMSIRTKKLAPDGDYLPDGRPPTGTPGEVTVRGSALRWQHPWDFTIVLLSPDYADASVAAEETRRQLLAQGFVAQTTVAVRAHVRPQTLNRRTRNLAPQGDYLPDGRRPTGASGEVTVKGSELRWQHPFDFSTVLLAPAYADAIVAAEEIRRQLHAQGFRPQPAVATRAHVSRQTLAWSTRRITPDDDYLPDGRSPTGAPGEVTVKGSKLRWQHPFDPRTILLAPSYASALLQEHAARKYPPPAHRPASRQNHTRSIPRR